MPDCDFCKQAVWDILLAKVQSNVWDFSTGWDMWDIQNDILLYTLYCTIKYYDILYDTDCLGKFYLIVLWFHVIPIYDISEARPTRYQNKCIFTYSLSKQSWIPLHGTGFTENCHNDNFWCRQSWRSFGVDNPEEDISSKAMKWNCCHFAEISIISYTKC